jgi:hypothetical protein
LHLLPCPYHPPTHTHTHTHRERERERERERDTRNSIPNAKIRNRAKADKEEVPQPATPESVTETRIGQGRH